MKNLVCVIFIVVAYFAGYMTPKNSVATVESTPPAFQAEPAVQDTSQGGETDITATSSNKKLTTVTDKKPKTDADSQGNKIAAVNEGEDDGVNSEAPAAAPPTNINTSEKSSIASSVKPLAEAEIDKLVPEPFNQYLKGHDAALLEKYRKFSEQENPSSQDSDILNKISDAIASNPYSKFLNIESFQCKANFCEIRLYESKPGVWSYIQAEMSLQDWWRFQSSSAHGFETGKENINGWYVLLTRD